jgi:hypothetical protein
MFLEKGSLEFSLHRYSDSFRSFDSAKEWMDHFITERLLDLSSYDGEIYDRAYALNFQMMAALTENQFEKAAVIARQMDVVLSEKKSDVYLAICDPVALGLVSYSFERYRNTEDALVYRRKQKQCLDSSLQSRQVDWSGFDVSKASGALIVLGEGFVGRKEPVGIYLPSPFGDIRASYTKYQEMSRPLIREVRVSWSGGLVTNQVVASSFDLDQNVVKVFFEQKSREEKAYAESKIAATLIEANKTYQKHAGRPLSTNPKEIDQKAFAKALSVVSFNNFFDSVDTKSWKSLPRVWWMIRLPAGVESVLLTFVGWNGQVIGQKNISTAGRALVFDRFFGQ